MEGRNPAKGKSAQGNPHRTSGRIIGGKTPLGRIRERAKEEVKIPEKEKRKFTNVLTHVRVDLLKEVFHRLKRKAAPGVDGRTWEDYAENLEGKLLDLQDRIHRMGYHPLPVKRKYIPKPDGRQRPLGIPAIEDKVVQGAITVVLTQIFEPEFRDTSYGFRPGRSQHDALQAVDRMMYRGKVNWVLEADICEYFDSIDHDWLIRMIGHRVTDSRMIRTIQRFLRAGVLEDEVLRETTEGTPQGGLISPLLANIYLHYALDLWFEVEKRKMKGEAHLVRYADDFIIGFQDQQEAKRFLEALKERLAKFGLQLHPEKTRLIRFGLFAERDCHLDGNDKPQTFDFLGFTHISGKSRSGKFQLVRRTSRKKRRAKLLALHSEMKERRHWKVTDQWKWLCSVLLGHYNYYAVTTNFPALHSFRYAVRRLWAKVLSRRSQRGRLSGRN